MRYTNTLSETVNIGPSVDRFDPDLSHAFQYDFLLQEANNTSSTDLGDSTDNVDQVNSGENGGPVNNAEKDIKTPQVSLLFLLDEVRANVQITGTTTQSRPPKQTAVILVYVTLLYEFLS